MYISVSDFLMIILYLLLDARTLPSTLYVCVFAFSSMLVNICLVYCLLKLSHKLYCIHCSVFIITDYGILYIAMYLNMFAYAILCCRF